METQEQQVIIDALYARMLKEKKGSKTYWEAKSDYHYANSCFHMQQHEALKDAIKDTEAGKMADIIVQLEKDVANLKAQLENADSERNEAVAAVEEERDVAIEEVETLVSAIGWSKLDYERAKCGAVSLPNGSRLS